MMFGIEAEISSTAEHITLHQKVSPHSDEYNMNLACLRQTTVSLEVFL
jgi:hypothetical protein